MKIIQHPSPNFGPRAGGKKPKFLILHYTAAPLEKSLFLLTGGDPAHQASAHYLVDEDGKTLQLVDENIRAWHAGKSYWEGEEDINSASIGVEIVNLGFGHPYPDVQIDAVAELCRGIIKRHHIMPWHVLAHSDISPGRKIDPGAHFPWKKLAAEGVGIWPEINDEKINNDVTAKTFLTSYGYNPNVDENILITDFQRHFEPELFLTSDSKGGLTKNTVKLLQALLDQKQTRIA